MIRAAAAPVIDVGGVPNPWRMRPLGLEEESSYGRPTSVYESRCG